MAGKAIKSIILCKGKHLLILLLFVFVSCKREGITDIQGEDAIPSIPANVNVYAANDGATGIEWSKNSGSNILGYNVYRSVNRPGYFYKIFFLTDNHFVDFPLEYDSTYYYAITAVSLQNRESAFSTIVNAKPGNLYPPTPIYDISINGRNNIDSKYMRLNWTPQQDHDIKGYEIYRSNTTDVKIEPLNLVGFANTPAFEDNSVDVLIKYYYKIISVDKGNLKSEPSPEVSDLILDSPELAFPANNTTERNLYQFKFKAVSFPARYKIVIQSNELYGTVAEYNFSSEITNGIITFNFNSNALASYRKYFWRVIAYSDYSDEPNSYSQLFSFTYIAE